MGRYIDLRHKKENGKPPLYTSAELEEQFYEFLDYCYENNNLPSIAGLKVYCGLSHQTYNNYEKTPAYFDVYSLIHDYLEHLTINSKFEHITDVRVKALLQKYHKYADKQQADTTNTNTNVTFDITQLTAEQREQIANTDSVTELMKIFEGLNK